MGKFQSKLGEVFYDITQFYFKRKTIYDDIHYILLFLIVWTVSKRRQSPEGKPDTTETTNNRTTFDLSSLTCSHIVSCSTGGSLVSNVLTCQSELELIRIHKTKLTEVKHVVLMIIALLYTIHHRIGLIHIAYRLK